MAREQFEVVLSKSTTVKIAELSARESDMADRIIGSDVTSLRISKVYAICSVRAVNGRVVAPTTSTIDYNALADQLTATEAFALVEQYNDHFAPQSDDDLKNGSNDELESPSPSSSPSPEEPLVSAPP